MSSRTFPKRMPAGWTPPVSAWSADFTDKTSELLIVCIGVQCRMESAFDACGSVNRFLSEGPENLERAKYADRCNVPTVVSISYFTSRARYDVWREASGFEQWWNDPARVREANGYFREVLAVPMDRIETIFSSESTYGAANTGRVLHGPIQEHNYWGSMRDRIAASAHSELASTYGKALPQQGSTDTTGRRLRVRPPDNLAVIRSGQDWSRCGASELATYDLSVRPRLIEGMEFLQKNPFETGCCEMRFAHELNQAGEPLKKSFGLGYFLTLEHLERWASSHPTHLAIFHSFLDMAQKHERLDLRLWHEVAVLPGTGQSFEYVNCHPQTGLLPYFVASE